MLEKLLKWDRETLIYLNGLGTEQSDIFWLITTNFLTWIPLFLFIIIVLVLTYNGKELLSVALSLSAMLIAVTVAIVLTKSGVGRLRPVNDTDVNTLLRVLTSPQDYSFFSGHAASSFSIITLAVLFLRKKVKGISFLFIWPLLFCFSRLYLGVHYPLDILAGSVVGILFGVIFYQLHLKFSAPYRG